MRKLVLVTLLLLVGFTASAQARVWGISGTPATYRALASLRPSVHADFVAFGSSVTPVLAEDRVLKATPMITWEPWTVSLAPIANGADDAYLMEVARQVASYAGVVYIRFGHEMNGNWYPWGQQPAEYIAAWRHLWHLFRTEGATNVRWVWAPDLLNGLPRPQWQQGVAAYWPGSRYVDVVGVTLVAYAFQGAQPLSYRFGSIDWLRQRYAKPVWLPEVKVDAAERYHWLSQLRGYLASRHWITGFVWSETPSVGQAEGNPTGNMDWSLVGDATARRLFARAVNAGG
jgi:hypothetical protein